MSYWRSFGVDWSNGWGGMLLQVFEYSQLFLQFCKWWELSNGLDDFKVALYIGPNHTDIGIHPDNSYLDTLEQPYRTTLLHDHAQLP